MRVLSQEVVQHLLEDDDQDWSPDPEAAVDPVAFRLMTYFGPGGKIGHTNEICDFRACCSEPSRRPYISIAANDSLGNRFGRGAQSYKFPDIKHVDRFTQDLDQLRALVTAAKFRAARQFYNEMEDRRHYGQPGYGDRAFTPPDLWRPPNR